MTARRFSPRHPYSLAVLLAVAVTTLAWVNRDARRLPGPGSVAPSFTATTLDGEVVQLEDYLGNVILLNIWATWCGPCREEMPSMERLYQHFQAQGEDFTILAVSVDAPLGTSDLGGNVGGDLQAFVDEFDLTFPILHDPSGKIQQIYYTTGVPESVIIGRDGIIYYKLAGATDWDSDGHRNTVARLLERETS
jgi:cytochrome c biogenesis protein CcmG, thiol:disulfide interchange protein DsbE